MAAAAWDICFGVRCGVISFLNRKVRPNNPLLLRKLSWSTAQPGILELVTFITSLKGYLTLLSKDLAQMLGGVGWAQLGARGLLCGRSGAHSTVSGPFENLSSIC